MSFSDEDVSEERIKGSVNDWRSKYPIASAIFDKIPSMDLGEVVGTMYLVDVVKTTGENTGTKIERARG